MEPALAEFTMGDLPLLCLAFVGGIAAAYGVLHLLGKSKLAEGEKKAEQLVKEATAKGDALVKAAEVDARAEFINRREELDTETNRVREELKEQEKRLAKREDNLEKKLDTLGSKEKALENQSKELAERKTALGVKEEALDAVLHQQRDTLLRITDMSPDEAKQLLLTRLEREVEQEAAALVAKMLNEAREEAEDKARDIVITAIQRYAAEHTCDSTVSTLDIPSDEMKGRVIGREGRNIRAFERATGVDLIVDDTPGVVVVSAFDPVRREVARLSLEKLIQDGRIHPARIEEVVEEYRKEVNRRIMEAGKKGSLEANVGGLHKKQVDLLGRLSYRTSYGQNVLRHSIEVAYLCQVMADELRLDGTLARRAGLLHDIGKAVDHEVEGGHPAIGADICKRFNEPEEVLNAIAGHHGDIEATSVYTLLVMAADAISAARPGGRRESLERYIKRLEALEEVATSFDGVRNAYAIQAGREVRVIVDAHRVDDKGAVKIARDIAKRIEEEMTYPGEVKVTLLREVRAVEYAR
jgi:ribonuclease Y